jgi:hypothetical protein
MGTHAMMATEHYLSALIGVEVLQRGGNAVDAAVAAIFAERAVKPHMHTIGGEVPMLIYRVDTQQVFAIPGEGVLAGGMPAALDALLTALDLLAPCGWRTSYCRRWGWPARVFRYILAGTALVTTSSFQSGMAVTAFAGVGRPPPSSIYPTGGCRRSARPSAIPTLPTCLNICCPR